MADPETGRGSPMISRLFALALLALPMQLSAETPPFGRLFLTPPQRAALDRQRADNPEFRPDAGSPAQITLNGEIRRGQRQRIRWINNEIDWRPPSTGPTLLVGDTLDATTGERRRLLGEGRIVIRPGQSPR